MICRLRSERHIELLPDCCQAAEFVLLIGLPNLEGQGSAMDVRIPLTKLVRAIIILLNPSDSKETTRTIVPLSCVGNGRLGMLTSLSGVL